MSRLVAIELENFMSITKARLEFDESGILNITGYNDSGKSALTRSLEVLYYDAYSSDQNKFIQDDKEYFTVRGIYDDGVTIEKTKHSNGKSIWEMAKNDQVIFSNQLADGVAAMGTIPEPIAKYQGVIKDEITDEKLNVRRNTDRLFLINTTGGDNYKIINSVLRNDILANSVKKLNEDRNKLQSEATSKATACNTLKSELEGIQVLDDLTTETIQTKTENLRLTKQRTEYLLSIQAEKEKFETINVHEELPTIDTSRLSAILQLQELQKTADIQIHEECTLIDTSRLMLLEQVQQLRTNLDEPIQPETHTVDTERFQAIRQIGEAFNNLWQATNDLNNTEQEHKQTLAELKVLSDQYGFKICKNCGTVAS